MHFFLLLGLTADVLHMVAGCPFRSAARCSTLLNKVDNFEAPRRPDTSAVETDPGRLAERQPRYDQARRKLAECRRKCEDPGLRPRGRKKRYRPLEVLPTIPEGRSAAPVGSRKPGQDLWRHSDSMETIRVLNHFSLLNWSKNPVHRADIASALRMFFLDPPRQLARLKPLLIDPHGFLHQEVKHAGEFHIHGTATNVPVKAVADALMGPNRWMARLLQRMAHEAELFKTNEYEYRTEASSVNKRVVQIARRSIHPPRVLFIIVSGIPNQQELRAEFRRAEREFHEVVPSMTTVRTLSSMPSI